MATMGSGSGAGKGNYRGRLFINFNLFYLLVFD